MILNNYFFYINIISFITILRKELLRIIRIWPQTLLPAVITSILYFFIFGNIIGKKIGQMCGYDYIQYIIPGLIMMSVITNSYSNVVSSFFSCKFQKNIEEMLISPTYRHVIILGFLFGGIFRSSIIFVFILFISLFFCKFFFYKILFIIFAYILTTVLFSLFGLINAIYAKKFDDISIVPTFVLTPLIYLGGIFYSINLLPEKIQIIILLNPIFYIVNIFRYSFLGISEINIFFSFFVMSCLIIFLYFVLIYYFKKIY